MPFETFPIPNSGVKHDELISRIADQHAMLMPVVTNLYAALDGRIQQQGAALGKIVNKLNRSLNGRIKQQGAALNGVAAPLYDALNSRIAQQGQSLALQAALLPRLSQPKAPALTQPVMPGTQSPFAPSLPGGTAGLLSGGSLPSTPLGIIPPSFPLTPAQIVPQVPEIQTVTAPNWMVLADCVVVNWSVLDQNDPSFPLLIANGSYVPIRRDFGGNYDSAVQWGRLHHQIIGYQDYEVALPNPSRIACEAWNHGGAGWPANGDFGSEIPTGYVPGQPVGDWPFDSQGNYIGS